MCRSMEKWTNKGEEHHVIGIKPYYEKATDFFGVSGCYIIEHNILFCNIGALKFFFPPCFWAAAAAAPPMLSMWSCKSISYI